MRILSLLLAWLPMMCMAQSQYCASYADFVASEWRDVPGTLTLREASNDNRLALVAKTEPRSLAKRLHRGTFALMYEDSLYLSLYPFNRFGDVFVRAWHLGNGRMLFARPDIVPSGALSFTYGGTDRPLNRRTFRSQSKLETLVCYVAYWDEQREELRLGRVEASTVEGWLQAVPDVQKKYLAYDNYRRESADVIIQMLLEANIIRATGK